MKSIFAITLHLFLFWTLTAQNKRVSIKQISFNEGLNDRVVVGIVEDKEGFLWVATVYAGINRYDGYEFLDLHEVFPDIPPLHHHELSKIIATSDGRILIFYANHSSIIDVFDPLTGQLQKVGLKDITGKPLSQLLMPVTRSDDFFFFSRMGQKENILYQLKKNYDLKEVLVVTQHKLKKYNRANEKELFLVSETLDKEGSFWVKDSEGLLYHYNTDFEILKNYDLADNRQGVHTDIHFFFEDSTGKIWLSYSFKDDNERVVESQIAAYDQETDRFILHSSLAKYGLFNQVIELEAGLLLFTRGVIGENGACLYNVQENWVEELNGYNFAPYGTRESTVQKESRNIYLIATFSGILKLEIKQKSIQTYLGLELEEGQYGRSGRGITGDSMGNIYFAFERNGWFHLNKRKANLPIQMQFDHEEFKEEGVFTFARNLFIDEDGIMWGSAYKHLHGLLISWNPQTNVTNVYPHSTRINNIFPTSKGIAILELKLGGFQLFDKQTKQFIPFVDKEEYSLFKEATLSALVERKDGKFWATSHKGLFLIDFQNQSTQMIELGENGGASLSEEPLFYVYQDTDMSLWIGTDGAGLKHYDPNSGTIEVFDEGKGLCNNKVVGIVPDDENHLWISTFNGLAYFDKKNKAFTNFSTTHGITHNEFNRSSFYKDTQGNFYFGGMNGFNEFRTSDLIDTSTHFAVKLSSITLWDEQSNNLQTSINKLTDLEEIMLPAENRFLKIKVTTTDYSNPSKNQYKYFLEGFHEDWQFVKSGNEIVFNYLPAGDYTLRIKGANNVGIWSKDNIQIAVVAKEHFYKSIWFFLILLILIAGALYGIFLQYRLSQVLKLQSMRTQISSDLHDEVGSSLTRLSMIMHSVDVDVDPDSAKSYLKKGNEVLMNSISKIRDVVWAIDSKNDQAGNLIDRMMDFAFDMLRAKNIDYQFETSDINRNQALPPLIRQNIYLIYKEAIHNIIKHSQANRVKVNFQKQGEHLHLSIQNNGLGQETKKVKGSGLSNMKLRAKRMGAEIKIGQEGTQFKVVLKIPF